MAGDPNNNRSKLTGEEIVALYQQGLSSGAIARMAGVSHVAIIGRLRRAGVARRSGARPRKYDRAAVVTDYLAGMTYTEVARKHGMAVSGARRVVMESGVPLRPIVYPRGEQHPCWRGGKTKSGDGYIVTAEGRLHRLEMQRELGRTLECWEAVHHCDGDKLNPEVGNLVVMPEREHQRFHTFIRHRGLAISRGALEKLCRCEKPYHWRFTVADMRAADLICPLAGRSRLAKGPVRLCRVAGCGKKHYGHGYCSMHWQRKKAIDNGGWTAGGGRKARCHIKKISETRTP